jgi:hypothetical protein
VNVQQQLPDKIDPTHEISIFDETGSSITIRYENRELHGKSSGYAKIKLLTESTGPNITRILTNMTVLQNFGTSFENETDISNAANVDGGSFKKNYQTFLDVFKINIERDWAALPASARQAAETAPDNANQAQPRPQAGPQVKPQLPEAFILPPDVNVIVSPRRTAAREKAERDYIDGRHDLVRRALFTEAERGDIPAARLLGIWLLEGVGGPPNSAQGRQWLATAISGGDTIAKSYSLNVGVFDKISPLDALTLVKNSAQSGNIDALFQLADWAKRGWPNNKADPLAAYKMFRAAGELGHYMATTRARDLEQQLTKSKRQADRTLIGLPASG